MNEQTWWQGDDARRYDQGEAPGTGGAPVGTEGAAWGTDQDRTVATPIAPGAGAYTYGHGPGQGAYPASGYLSAYDPAGAPGLGAEPVSAARPPGRPKGIRNWPISAWVTAGALAVTTVLGFAAAGAPEEAAVEAGATTTDAPATTVDRTTSTTAPPTTTTLAPTTTTTMPPTTAPPTAPPTTAAPAPPPTAAPSPAPAPAPALVYYENCDAARAAGAAPVHEGDPGYASHLDRDGDGVGCE